MTATVSTLSPMHILIYPVVYPSGKNWIARYGPKMAVEETEEAVRKALQKKVAEWVGEMAAEQRNDPPEAA